ncbi:GATA-type zinc finger protein 1 [Corythoichthys intestinalis]|uniref:GATA-type zinc finger protein 1 n=1 Tax=Corythoichthys intestinalis TaxID=161448 RepID=UPI0025A667C4|nr:GATA-type zinc finger protein 1 [Corythoichthys intestinalis]XP_057700096.1 GATA-type zinc finger protein 1 [Corythoichthys intestinalis]
MAQNLHLGTFSKRFKLEASLQSGLLETTSLSYLCKDSHTKRVQNCMEVETLAKSPLGDNSSSKALSLINMQCEKLMHVEQQEPDTRSVLENGGCIECTLRSPPAAGISVCIEVDKHEDGFGSKLKSCKKDFTSSSQIADKDAIMPEKAAHSPLLSETELAMSVDSLKVCHDSFLAKHHHSNAHVSAHMANAFPDKLMGLERSLCLDQNSNILECRSPSKPNDIVSSMPHGPNVAVWEHSSAATVTSELKSNEENKNPRPLWRSKKPRKQPNPCRSADIKDPNFQGVTFRINVELDDNREECRLLITSKYSKELCKSVRKRRTRRRGSQMTGSSDEDIETATRKAKMCASCCTRKTPMWRDAEDGTPLCNACGIRYKKYRVRCTNCWNIPRKEYNSTSFCLKCGNVRLKHIV